MARRALVLGGGGISGIAWETGILAGLAQHGVDLAAADTIIGTSAGSVVGAILASGAPLEDLYAAQLGEPTGEVAAGFRRLDLLRFMIALLWPGTDAAARARLGRLALRARTQTEAERRTVLESRLGHLTWTDRRLLVTAVDAESGEPRIFDRDSGVPLFDAVMASCAVPLVWPPVSIGARRYVDGGVRSVTNADLAAGHERVVVIAPITAALRRSGRIRTQIASLGPEVRSIAITPDDASRKALGRNVLDPRYRTASARAGRTQADRVAHDVSRVWSG